MKVAERQSGPTAAAPSEGADAIGAWLHRLLRLTRLPARHAAELRDELDAHLRERVRDLMLSGNDEPDAIHKAIAELGDLALLAHRYRDAHRTPKGRLVMHTMLVTAVAAALGVSTIALRQSGQPETPAADEAVPLLSDIPILGYTFGAGVAEEAAPLTVRSDVANDPLEVVLAGFGDAAEASVFVYWSELARVGASPDTELSAMPLGGQTVQKALDMISDTLDLNGGMRLDHRVENGLMEIATREFFDQRELELVSYDARALLGADSPLYQGTESAALINLVTTLVEPDVWQTNGGFAGISAAGNRLFINAPRRLHERVAWLLAELMQNQGAQSARERPGPATPGADRPADGASAQPGLPAARAGESDHAFRISAPDGAIRMEILSSAGEPQVLEASRVQISGGTITQIAGSPAKPYAIQAGDTLASIAERFLGSSEYADDLLGANAGLAADSLTIGRVILVPVPGLIGIEGAVTRPGRYRIPPGGGFTLRRLLTAAGGSMPGAEFVTVRRGEGSHSEVVHTTTIAELATDPGADKPLAPGDSVQIGRR